MRKGKRLAWLLASIMLAWGAVAVGNGTQSAANADVIRPYLYWSRVVGECGGNWRNFVGTRWYNPSYRSVTKLRRTETTSTTMTRIWNQNGVRQAKVYDACRLNKIVRSYNPSIYKHRIIRQHFVCYAGRCRLTSTNYSRWFRGVGYPK
jgi:hypothetical protein